MEVSSNGKLEEIQKVESQDEDKEVVVEDSEEFKTEAESVREIVVNGNSESVTGDNDGHDSSSHGSSSDEEAEPIENSPHVEGSGQLEEEKMVISSVIDPVEPEVSLSEELTEEVEVAVEVSEAPADVAESEAKEIEGNISQSLEETIVISKVIEEATLLPDENDGVSPGVTEVESKTIGEITVHSSEQNNGVSPVVVSTIGEISFPSSEENGDVPPATDVVSDAIEETKLPVLEQNIVESSGNTDLEPKAEVDEPLQTVKNTGTVDTNEPHEYANKPETVPGNAGNPPIISLTQRTFRPTSWRSCCGLFEVLRRSDR